MCGLDGSPAEGGKHAGNECVEICVAGNRPICVREGGIHGSIGSEGVLDMGEEVGGRFFVTDRRTWGKILFDTCVVNTVSLAGGGR